MVRTLKQNVLKSLKVREKCLPFVIDEKCQGLDVQKQSSALSRISYKNSARSTQLVFVSSWGESNQAMAFSFKENRNNLSSRDFSVIWLYFMVSQMFPNSLTCWYKFSLVNRQKNWKHLYHVRFDHEIYRKWL